MAPRKRTRDEAVDEEVVEVESASSSLRQGDSNKRARISNAKTHTQRADSITSESDNEESTTDVENASHDEPPPPSTQYEFLRDGNFEHLANPDLDDQRATQRFLARNQMLGQNHAAENSIIKEITCINFMCHDKLHVELGPLINFVVGMNGSGKSAVLTAITLCLAGKTSSTMRGNNMKVFVKSGKDQGLIIVKLKNEGEDAYQPDVFGDTIIVERHFTANGTGGYKLKSATGRTISTKKSDIEDIVEYFQLQVDNPMTVLTQDKAKTFLTKSTPAQKYDFFVEGVQLKALDADYKIVSEYCDTLTSKLKDIEQNLKILKKKAEAAKAKYDMVRKHEGTRREARRIRNMLSWAQVEEQETKLRDREDRISEAEAKKEEWTQKAGAFDIQFQQADNLWEQAKEAEQRTKDELGPLNVELEAAKAAHQSATEAVAKFKSTRDSIVKSMEDGKKKMVKIKSDICAEEQRLEDINGGSLARKRAAIEEAKQFALDANAAHKEAVQQTPDLEKKFSGVVGDAKDADKALKNKITELDAARSRLSELNTDRGNLMAGFDPKMPNLMELIRKDNGFREKPVGPMGLHMRLLDGKWSTLVERTIGLNLNGFVVTSKFDQIHLNELIRRAGVRMQTPVVIGNHSTFDTTGHEPDPGYTTMLRVLEFENDLVRRQMIINHGLDQTLLFEDLATATKVMYEGPRPKNVRQCFAINVAKRGWGHRLAFAGANGRDLQPVRPIDWRPKIKSDIELQIASQQLLCRDLEKEKSQLETAHRLAQQQSKNANLALSRHKTQTDHLKIDAQRADERVDNLQNELENDVVEDGRLELLKENLKEAEESIAIDEEAYGNHMLEKEKVNQAALDKKRGLDGAKSSIAEHEIKVLKAQNKVKEKHSARGTLLHQKNEAIDGVEQYEAARVKLEAKRDQQLEQVAQFVAGASEVCPRVSVDEGESTDSLFRKFNKLKQQLDNYAKQQGGTDEQIEIEASEAVMAYESMKGSQIEIAELNDLLKQSFTKRISMFRRFQQFISARSRINFNYLLSERAFRGKLNIDHKLKLLDVHVEPDETTKSGKGRQTKTLSGGEKSFSNICLLLSLWEAMGQPLRCLDEFDVFMDDVNRDVSTKMIISAARRSVGRQFILITPKGIGNGVNGDKSKDKNGGTFDPERNKDVKIIKLTDPREKNQRRIDDMVNGDD